MVYFGASSNVMPLYVCHNINLEFKPCNLKIIQLDRTNVIVFFELKDVLIRLSSNPKVHQVIDIVVIDIPKVYGLFLSRDCLEQLHDYFSTDWSHMWLLENDQPKKIRINRECYLKYTVTDLNDPNEPIMFSNLTLENYCIDSFFGNFFTKPSLFVKSGLHSEILQCTQVVEPICV